MNAKRSSRLWPGLSCVCRIRSTTVGVHPLKRVVPGVSGSGFAFYGCRANMAHASQSKPDSGLDFHVRVLNQCRGVASSLGSGYGVSRVYHHCQLPRNPAERGLNISKGFEDVRTENGSSQGQNLALVGNVFQIRSTADPAS